MCEGRAPLIEAVVREAELRARDPWRHPCAVETARVCSFLSAVIMIRPPPPFRESARARAVELDALTCCMWRCVLAFARERRDAS